MEVREDQYRLFQILRESSSAIEIQELAVKTGMEQAMAMGTVSFAQEKNWVTVEEFSREEIVPAKDVHEVLGNGLPEKRFLSILKEAKSMPMKEVASKAKEMDIKVNEIIKWGTLRGWLDREQGNLVITEKGTASFENEDIDEVALKAEAPIFIDAVAQGDDVERLRKLLKNRAELAKIKTRNFRKVILTETGREEIIQLKIKQEEKNRLTSEDITSGKWREVNLRPYDVTLPAEKKAIAKEHPLQKIIQVARRVFLEMGFNEAVSSHVESGFWDFDVLFQPQDHPARDMQDTFYLKRPAKGELPDEELVDKVRRTHENGWKTGSSGWGYRWSPEVAKQMILRTHTTATSAQAILKNPNPPQKVFCIGRVFRNETISFKHLPEFHQVEGIIIDKNASFCALLGTLAQFYRKMGFEKVKFKPSFFPYTEPSAEVFVWMEDRKCWIELGGCGVFRPEVTQPLGCRHPVLAWGLGLERLAMMRYGINDIRTLYGSDLSWLQEVALCR